MNRIREVASILRRLCRTGSDGNRLVFHTNGVISDIVEVPRRASDVVALSGVDAYVLSISADGPAPRFRGNSNSQSKEAC